MDDTRTEMIKNSALSEIQKILQFHAPIATDANICNEAELFIYHKNKNVGKAGSPHSTSVERTLVMWSGAYINGFLLARCDHTTRRLKLKIVNSFQPGIENQNHQMS